MRVLGVDPGMADTGWAVVDGGPSGAALAASGVIRTPAGLPLPLRLRQIHDQLTSVLLEHKPEAMAIEELFFLKAAQSVRSTLQARGVILLCASQCQSPVTEYNPRQVKVSLTGSGAAPKPQMQKMVQAALALKEVLRPDDVADAAAIALCHLRASRHKTFKVLDRVGARP